MEIVKFLNREPRQLSGARFRDKSEKMSSLERRLWPDSCGFLVNGNIITQGIIGLTLKSIKYMILSLKIHRNRRILGRKC